MGLLLWRDAAAGCSPFIEENPWMGQLWAGCCGGMLWRGALARCSGGVLASRGQPEASKKPARGQQEASKRPGRGQEEAPNWGGTHETPKPLQNMHFHEENSPVLRAL